MSRFPTIRPIIQPIRNDLISRSRIAGVGGLVLDPDAAAWVALVETADGAALPDAVKVAASNLIAGLKSDASPKAGVSQWAALQWCHLLAGPATLNGIKVPLKGTAGTFTNFVSGDYKQWVGLIGDYSTKTIESNRANSADAQDNIARFCYVSAPPSGQATFAQSAGFFGPASNGQTGNCAHWMNNNSGTYRTLFYQNSSSSAVNSPVPWNANVGIVGLSRNNSANLQVRDGFAAGVVQTKTATSQAPFAGTVKFYQVGTPSPIFSDVRMAAVGMGASVDLAALQTRFSTYFTEAAGGFDPDARQYIDAVEAADGATLSAARRTAINTLVAGLKGSASLISGLTNWQQIESCHLLAGPATLAGAKVPLKGNAMTFQAAFVSGDYSQATGLRGGTGRYINAQRSTFVEVPENSSYWSYLTEVMPASPDPASLFGSASSDTQGSAAGMHAVGGIWKVQPRGNNVYNVTAGGSIAASLGLVGFSRFSASQYSVRAEGVVSTETVASVANVANNVSFYAKTTTGINPAGAVRKAAIGIGGAIDLAAVHTLFAAYVAAIA